jgi:HK97 family phage prohead protease
VPSAPVHRSSLHANFSGSHSHSHPANGSQGGDATHTHEHAHDADANHDHHGPNNGDPNSGDEDLSRGRAVRADYRNIPEQRISTGSHFELREVPDGTGGTNLKFTGFASTTGDDATYEMEDWLGPWTESIGLTAFDKTLADGPDVAFLLNHSGMTLARTKPGTLKLSAVKDGSKSPVYGVTGLHSEALLDPQNMYVQAMRSAVERGDLDEMSFAFRVLRQDWSKDWDRRWINEVSLDKGDVSLVNYGANPHTGGTVTLRQRFTGRTPVGQLTPFGFMADSGYEGRKRQATRVATSTWIDRQRVEVARDRGRLNDLRVPAWKM